MTHCNRVFEKVSITFFTTATLIQHLATVVSKP